MATRANQTSPVVRAGIYTRISGDPAGQRAGVERQRVDREAVCAGRSWEIAHCRHGRRAHFPSAASLVLIGSGGCRLSIA